MRQQLEMEALSRTERGKNASRRLRKDGKVPAVLYGLGKDPVALCLDTKSIARVLQSGHNQIVNLSVDGGERAAVLAVDWQLDPVRGNLLHVDMQRVDLDKPVEVLVSIVTVGIAQGVKEQGGLEEIVTREVELTALPLDVPEKIEIDVSKLMVGQSVRVRDLPLSDKYTVQSSSDRVLVHVITPKVVEEAAPVEAEAEAPAEPEVIEKGKAEEKEKKEQPEREKGKE